MASEQGGLTEYIQHHLTHLIPSGINKADFWAVHIDSITVKGDTVVFTLKTEDVPAAYIINQQLIVPEHIWKDVKDPVTWKNEKPVTTGPFVLDTFTANQYTLKKNKDYWQADKVAVDKLVLPAANSQLDVVKNGYDWAYAFMTDVEGTWVAADSY